MTQYLDLAEYTIDQQLTKAVRLATRARRAGVRTVLFELRALGKTLTATRQNLTEQAEYYLPTARAVVTVADKILDRSTARIERAEIGIDRHTCRVHADDVIAWCEFVGVELLPWQRSYIEGRLSA